MKNFCIILICMIFYIININGQGYKTGNFKEKTGLYFHDLGPISISREAYRFLVYLDLDYILSFNANLELTCLNKTSTEHSSICTAYYSIPEKVALKQNTTLKNLELDQINLSSKEKTIFLHGNFNPEDMHAYDKLSRTESHLHFKNGKSQIPIFVNNSEINFINIYENKFGSKFPDRLREIKTLEQHFGELPAEKAFEINQLFHHWKSQMDILEDAVSLAKKGEIHSTIFTPNLLIHALKDAKGVFKDAVLPSDLERLKYEDIINVSNFRISIMEAMLIYDIEVPMIEKDSYKLYRLVPWPMKLAHQDAYFFVEPTEDFIAIKAHHHSYIPFKEDEIQNCKSSQEKKLCSVPSTVINLDLTNTCESALISNHRDDFLSVCSVKLIKFKETVWHRLDNANLWLFTTSQDSINVTCSQESIVNVALNNSGWIKLNSSCIAISNLVTLKPFQKHSETNLIPQLTFFKLNVANKVEENLKNSKVELTKIDLYDFGRKVYLDLSDLKLKGTFLSRIKNKSSLECNHIWLWSFIIVVSLLFIGYVLYETVIKNKFCNKGSSRLSEEFSRKKFVSSGELILGRSNPVLVQSTVSQNTNTEEHMINNW